MRFFLCLLILLVPACASKQLKPKEQAITVNAVDNWDYPGRFYPVAGEHVAHFFNTGNTVSACQMQTLNEVAVMNINSFIDSKKMVVEEKRNFIQFNMKPGSDWLIVKNQDPQVALYECLSLQKYLVETFNFSVKTQ